MADHTPTEQNTSPWAQRGFVVAAGFVAVLVLVGAVLFIAGRGDNGDAKQAPQGNGAPSTSKVRKDPAQSVCGLPAGKQSTPVVPPDATWQLVGTIAAPSAPKTAGPGIHEGKRRLCFAHSPTGALFAAVNFVAIAALAPNDEALLRELTAEGRARDELLAQRSDSSDAAFRMQVAGFRLDGYGGDETTVDLAFRTSANGSLVHVALPFRWERGDWKAVIATSEGPFAAIEPLQNLSGYVPWGGA